MFSRKRRERRGNYSALMFSLMEIVVGFGALSVDVSLITMSELQVQATSDAAAHAAHSAKGGALDRATGWIPGAQGRRRTRPDHAVARAASAP